MKKIMLALAVAVLAVAANAASFKWTGANIYGADGTTKYTGTAEIYAYATSGTIADDVQVTDAFVIGGTFKSDAAGTATGFTFNWSEAVVDTNYNFFFVINDNGKEFNSATANPSVIKTGIAAATSTTTIGFANMTSATQAATNWASADVPEPTSGLLLLLGVAGLALRRKQK